MSLIYFALCAGTSETKVFDEQSPPGNDYLAQVKKKCLLSPPERL